MKAEIKMFSGAGDTVLMEYDTDTADMKEVNRFVHSLEKGASGRAFDLDTGEAISNVTRDNADIAVIRPIAGG